MTINTARFIDPHPVPVFETHFPQFLVYPNIPQNLMRPTWKGTTRGLGRLDETGGAFFDDFMYGDPPACDEATATAFNLPSCQMQRNIWANVKYRSANRTLIIGGVAGLLLGAGLGFWLGRRK